MTAPSEKESAMTTPSNDPAATREQQLGSNGGSHAKEGSNPSGIAQSLKLWHDAGPYKDGCVMVDMELLAEAIAALKEANDRAERLERESLGTIEFEDGIRTRLKPAFDALDSIAGCPDSAHIRRNAEVACFYAVQRVQSWLPEFDAALAALPADREPVAQDRPIAWRCTSMEGKRVVWVDHLMDEQISANEIMLADEIIPLYAAPAAQEQPDHYVAWLRYDDHNGDRPTTIHLCDSDTPGAFKVYRAAVPLDTDYLASRLIDAWCDDKGRQIPWAKAVQIIAIVTKQSDAERDRLLRMGDEDGSCGMCGRSDATPAWVAAQEMAKEMVAERRDEVTRNAIDNKAAVTVPETMLCMARELREYAQLLDPQLSLRRMLFEAIQVLETGTQEQQDALTLVDRALKIFLQAIPQDQMVTSEDYNPIKAWIADAAEVLKKTQGG